jgi:hypothetical protein
MTSGRGRIVVCATAALAYAVLASFTRPFTWAAEVVTAVPLAAAVLVTAWSGRNAGRSDTGTPAGGEPGHPSQWGRRWLVWITLIIAVTGWELHCLWSLPRVDHPTLSTLLDLLQATQVGKTMAFASWLALGWFLVV